MRLDRFAGDFRRAVDFRAPVRLAVDFRLAVGRFAVPRLAVDLRAVERLAVDRFAVERGAVLRFAVVLRPAVLALRRAVVPARFAVLLARAVAFLARLVAFLAVRRALWRAVVVVFLPRRTISFATFPACSRTVSALVVMASAASRALSAARFAAPTAAKPAFLI